VPLVFNMHFTGTMDHWDPAVTDGFAKDRSPSSPHRLSHGRAGSGSRPKRAAAAKGGLPNISPGGISSYSMSLAICPSPRVAASYYST
jgi:hypothetical protein